MIATRSISRVMPLWRNLLSRRRLPEAVISACGLILGGCLFYEKTIEVATITTLTAKPQTVKVSLSNKVKSSWFLFLDTEGVDKDILQSPLRVDIANTTRVEIYITTLQDPVRIPAGETRCVFDGVLGKQMNGTIGVGPHDDLGETINLDVIYHFGRSAKLDRPISVFANTADGI